jgi:uncharacterized membrane protein YebE (DUF533 family)
VNAERLLGSLVMGGLGRGRGLRGDARLALGMGAVALAIAAFEHFVEQRRSGISPAPPGEGLTPPPPQQPISAPPAPSPSAGDDALLLVRAMIAAAAADGVVDEEERAAVLDRLARAGLTDEERTLVERELTAPPSRETVVAGVTSPELAEQVYIVSLLAIRVDNEAERSYLPALAKDLALPGETTDRLHGALGVTLR